MADNGNFRVNQGVNTDTLKPFYYPEYRAAKGRWCKMINGKNEFVRFDTEAEAQSFADQIRDQLKRSVLNV